MAVDVSDFKIRQCHCVLVKGKRIIIGHAKLVFLEAGRDIRMRFGIDVGIDTQADGRFFTQHTSDFIESLKFGCGFNVETKNIMFERRIALQRFPQSLKFR